MKSFDDRIEEAYDLYFDAKDTINEFSVLCVDHNLGAVFSSLDLMKEKFAALHVYFHHLITEFIGEFRADELVYWEEMCKKLQSDFLENAREILNRFNELTGNDLEEKEIAYYVRSMNTIDGSREAFCFDVPLRENKEIIEDNVVDEDNVIG